MKPLFSKQKVLSFLQVLEREKKPLLFIDHLIYAELISLDFFCKQYLQQHLSTTLFYILVDIKQTTNALIFVVRGILNRFFFEGLTQKRFYISNKLKSSTFCPTYFCFQEMYRYRNYGFNATDIPESLKLYMKHHPIHRMMIISSNTRVSFFFNCGNSSK